MLGLVSLAMGRVIKIGSAGLAMAQENIFFLPSHVTAAKEQGCARTLQSPASNVPPPDSKDLPLAIVATEPGFLSQRNGLSVKGVMVLGNLERQQQRNATDAMAQENFGRRAKSVAVLAITNLDKALAYQIVDKAFQRDKFAVSHLLQSAQTLRYNNFTYE